MPRYTSPSSDEHRFNGTTDFGTGSSQPLPNTSNNSPLAAAKEKLQSSAREILRNLETAMGTSGTNSNTEPTEEDGATVNDTGTPEADSSQLEQAFRLFFSSCTNGAVNMSIPEEEEPVELVSVSGETSSDKSASQATAPLPLPATTKRSSAAKESLRRLAARHVQANKDATIHVVPASQQPTEPHMSKLQQKQAQLVDSLRQAAPTTTHAATASAAPPAGSHIYEHLFYDEEQAAAQAHLTQQRRPSRNSDTPALLGATPLPKVSPEPPVRQSKKPSKMFPVTSSPVRERAPQCRPDPRPPSLGITILQSPTFDDNISAISNHTLEAMAARDTARSMRSRSMESAYSNNHIFTSGNATTNNALYQHQQPPPNSIQTSSYSRNRVVAAKPQQRSIAHHTVSSLNVSAVNSSMSTRTPDRSCTPLSQAQCSTQSNNDKSFEQWQNAEQQYWVEQVATTTSSKSGGRRSKLHGGGSGRQRHRQSRKTADATMSTTSSTALSRSSSWLEHAGHHPHETLPFDASDLVFAGHETGEI